jgi:serine/threonine-protein kinase RsbW
MEKLTLTSNLSNITIVEKFVEEICDNYNLNNTYFGNILIALTESFTNAVVHGNQNDPQKKVTIMFDVAQKGLSFSVSDEGQGFDSESVTNPVDAVDDKDAENGRGIFLIRSLTDDVKFVDNGRTIEMVFEIEGIGQKTMKSRTKLFSQYFKKEGKQQQVKR